MVKTFAYPLLIPLGLSTRKPFECESRANALAPFFWVVTHHIARNQTGKGSACPGRLCRLSLMFGNRKPHTPAAHFARGHDLPPPQRGHRKPFGYRSRLKYARQASSVAKSASNSVRFRGYSSTMLAYYPLGLPESSRYRVRDMKVEDLANPNKSGHI